MIFRWIGTFAFQALAGLFAGIVLVLFFSKELIESWLAQVFSFFGWGQELAPKILGPAAIFAAAILTLLLLLVAIRQRVQLVGLAKWRGIEDTTELQEYAKEHEESDYHPTRVWRRDDLKDLCVMGNGCSKWTALTADAQLQVIVRSIAERGGTQMFMASSPAFLDELAKDATPESTAEWLQEKAKHNAISLLKLRRLQIEAESHGGSFEIRTYDSLATLRIVIINSDVCVVGHYKETAMADSNQSPLLVFRKDPENDWGFYGGFRRVFDDQWALSKEITPAKWAQFKNIAARP